MGELEENRRFPVSGVSAVSVVSGFPTIRFLALCSSQPSQTLLAAMGVKEEGVEYDSGKTTDYTDHTDQPSQKTAVLCQVSPSSPNSRRSPLISQARQPCSLGGGMGCDIGRSAAITDVGGAVSKPYRKKSGELCPGNAYFQQDAAWHPGRNGYHEKTDHLLLC